MSKKQDWYSIKAKSTDSAEIFIYGVIVAYAWDETDVTAKRFIDDLKALGDVKHIDLRINSDGGNVFAGNAIYNALKRHPAKITTHVDGLAASIASVIAMAGDTIVMPENAMMMIHDPAWFAAGTAKDLRKAADVLDKTKSSLISAYQAKTGLEDDYIANLMDEETWMTAAEALELGFADSVAAPVEITAQYDLSRYKKAPVNLLTGPVGQTGRIGQKKKEETPMNLEDLKAKHGDLVAQIEASARQGMVPESEVTAKITAARAEGAAAERERIKGIEDATVPGYEADTAPMKFDGKSTAADAALAIVAKEKALKNQALNAIVAEAPKALANPDPGTGGSGAGAKTFEALVAEYMEQHKCKKSVAIAAVTKAHPAEHAAYIERANPKK